MIFIHDHKFINKNGKIYTSGSLNNKVFQRYLYWFDDVTVFANEYFATRENTEVINDYNEVTNVEFELVNKKNREQGILTTSNKLKTAIDKNSFVIVRMPSLYGILAVSYAKKTKKKYLIELVGCPWDSLWNHSLKGKVVAPFMWFFTKKILRDASYVVYVTNVFLQKRYPTKGISIGCSDVILPSIEGDILLNRITKIKHMKNTTPVIIGTIAAMNVQYKGQDSVIKAISQLNKEGYNFEYHLAGGGDNRYLKDLAKKYEVDDKVVFMGTLSHKSIFEYLDTIDIYIQPSKTEGLPRALVEAMSRACPSLGSKAGGIPELINEELTFSPGSVDEICGLLKKMDKRLMLDEANRSFEKAKEFNYKLLDQKRNKFYKLFSEGVCINND
ncbi:glycosyltransferase [Sporosarcina sp. P29]|uniref:glycosyltransferase n=1 Tax=Sporosarcina sp. P29 TaxID=2048252 RepID=UPI000C1696B6|nr:glycosyltransferase [Sporosarcina sp. P29]PIC99891.1 glycosyl transferase [Sporosarcina sp. P29]